MILLPTFEERYNYLRMGGKVGGETFGWDRYFNQAFYKSKEWLHARQEVILRDNGCDLGIKDREIMGRIIVHHMNPVDTDDILLQRDILLNPEFLICVGERTHNALHYGSFDLLTQDPIERKPNDTCPWKH